MSAAAPRVAQVVSSLGVGGAERAALEIAAGLRGRGWEGELVVVRRERAAGRGAEPLRAEARRRGVPLRELSLSSVRRRAERAAVTRFLSARGYQLVNVHNRPCDWQLVLLGRRAGVRVLYTRQLPYADASRRQRALYFAAARVAPAVVAITHAVADHLRRVERTPRRKIHVIPDGVDVERYRPPSDAERVRARAALDVEPGSFVWLAAARLVPQKGHAFLLRALARLANGLRTVLLAGAGSEEARLRALARELGLGQRVRFLGARSDVRELLWAADGYVCTSLGEGQGISLVEALATGLPLVAPRLACIEEIAPPRGVWWFGPRQGDWAAAHDEGAIAAALRHVEDLDARDATCARRHVVERYSVARMLDGYERLYRELLVGAAQSRSSASK